MMTIRFPRWNDDIRTEKRTLVHLPLTSIHGVEETRKIFMLLPNESSVGIQHKHARIIHAEVVPFNNWVPDDVRKLNLPGAVGAATTVSVHRQWARYRERWEALHGPSDSNVSVVYVEFEYIEAPPTPEQCIAA